MGSASDVFKVEESERKEEEEDGSQPALEGANAILIRADPVVKWGPFMFDLQSLLPFKGGQFPLVVVLPSNLFGCHLG